MTTTTAGMNYPIKKILAQKKRKYLVEWDGVNPDTGLPWPQSWEPKANLNADALYSWQEATGGKRRKLDNTRDDGGSKRASAANAQPEVEAHGWSVLESAPTAASAGGSGPTGWHVPGSVASSTAGVAAPGDPSGQRAAVGLVQTPTMADTLPSGGHAPSQLSGSIPAPMTQQSDATLPFPQPGVSRGVQLPPFAQRYDNRPPSQHPPAIRETHSATPENAVTPWIGMRLQQMDNLTGMSAPERADPSILQPSVPVGSSEEHTPNDVRGRSSVITTPSPADSEPTDYVGLVEPVLPHLVTTGPRSAPMSAGTPQDGETSTDSVAQLSVYDIIDVEIDESVVRRSLAKPTAPLNDGEVTASQPGCGVPSYQGRGVGGGSGGIDTSSGAATAAVFPGPYGGGGAKITLTLHAKLLNTPGSPNLPPLPTSNPNCIPTSLDEELDRFAAAFGVTPAVVIGQAALFQRRKDEGGWYEHPAL